MGRDEHVSERARHYFQQLTQAAPLREVGYRGLMRALAGLGRFAEALAVFETCSTLLSRELGVEPETETKTLREQLQGEWEVAQQQAAQAQLWQRPFTGRQSERATLIDALDNARQGRGGVIAVEGDAGMGKSRLLAEIVKSAEWRKMSVVQGTAEALRPFLPSHLSPTACPLRLPGRVWRSWKRYWPTTRWQRRPSCTRSGSRCDAGRLAD